MRKTMRTFVIEEDEHLQNLRKIIKRDFFTGQSELDETEAVKLTLNDYLSNYKSNQNQLFSEMVHTNNEEWKKNHWWIDSQDKLLMIQSSQQFRALPYHNMLQKASNINGINTSIVKQDAKNSFFFNRQKNFGSLQSGEYEQAKKVVYRNCRLQDQVSRQIQIQLVKKQQITPVRRNQSNWQGKYKQGNVNNSSADASPDKEDGPLMTWGQIENTPLRIAGPQFRIPDTPQRDLLLSSLNNKMNKQKLQANKKSERVLKILGSLTPASSRQRITSSIRRATDSIRRQRQAQKEKSDISGLLNIKK